MARVGVKAEHPAGHNLPTVPEASFGIQSARDQHSGNCRRPVAPGPRRRFFDYVLKKAVEYSNSVGPEPLKSRTDRHESDT